MTCMWIPWDDWLRTRNSRGPARLTTESVRPKTFETVPCVWEFGLIVSLSAGMVGEYSHTHTTTCLPSYGVAGTTSSLVHSLKETILCNQALTMLLCNRNFLYLAKSDYWHELPFLSCRDFNLVSTVLWACADIMVLLTSGGKGMKTLRWVLGIQLKLSGLAAGSFAH